MVRGRTRAVCEGLRAALVAYGSAEQILTDTTRCSPAGSTTAGGGALRCDLSWARDRALVDLATLSDHDGRSIERFHRNLRVEFPSENAVFGSVENAQQTLDE
jgi:hypothetical protein